MLNRRVAIALVLCLQACLLFCALELLPIWTDELFTLNTVARPIREIIPIVQRDIHPPLYFIALRAWTKMPLPWTGVAALRAFSVMWALLATLFLDLFWTRNWQSLERYLALSLFAFSPCLLVYSRMARSYSMQVALALLALALLQYWMRAPASRRFAVGAAIAMLGLLYTHYVPGIAILAGFVIIGWRSVGTVRTALFLTAIVAGYFPWLMTLTHAMERWREVSRFSATYSLTGNPVLEQFLKLGFGVVSLTIGESFLALSFLLVPVIVLLVILGARKPEFPKPVALMLIAAAAVGYFGVSRWVSYAFIPARLLWLLPFLSMAVALGTSDLSRRSFRNTAILLLALSYFTSDFLYFRRENFVNLGYAAPLREIAAMLNREARPEDVILADSYNTDSQALRMYLSGRTPVVTLDPPGVSTARRLIRFAPTTWIVRNTRDISPGSISSRLQSEACAGRPERDTLFEPYAPWQKVALRIAGLPQVTHFYQLTACGPGAGRGDSVKLGNGEK